MPAFCTVTTFALSDHIKNETFNKHNVVIDEVNLKNINDLKEKYNVKLSLLDTLGAYGNNNIIFTAREFNPKNELNSFFYSGPMIPNNHHDFPFHKLDKNKKTLTMAFGTILLNEDPTLLRFYQMLVGAFAEDQNYQIILAVGPQKNCSLFENLPANVMAFPKIPQTAVLEYTDCFISHGGMNSINEALYFGVPLVLIPHSHDQFGNAQRVVDLGLGVSISMEDMSKDLLKKSIIEVLANKELDNNLVRMSKSFRKCEGLKGIMNYIGQNL